MDSPLALGVGTGGGAVVGEKFFERIDAATAAATDADEAAIDFESAFGAAGDPLDGDQDDDAGQYQISTSEARSELGYSGTSTAKIIGITYRQLDYWARTELVRPSRSDLTGSGSRRRYSYDDLLQLKAIKKLLDSGIKLEQVRKVFDNLREHVGENIDDAHTVIDGGSVEMVDGSRLIDLLNSGEGVLNVLSWGGVRKELDEDLADADEPPLDTDGESPQ